MKNLNETKTKEAGRIPEKGRDVMRSEEEMKRSSERLRAKRKHFQKGSGCYTCVECGKLTRETGECESGCQLCRKCYEIAGLENELQDGEITQEEYDRQVAEIRGEKAKG